MPIFRKFYNILGFVLFLYIPHVFTINHVTVDNGTVENIIPGRKPLALLHSHEEHLQNTSKLKHHMMFYLRKPTEESKYKAFCVGNIITTKRILSAAVCFFYNSKRPKIENHDMYAVAGVLKTYIAVNSSEPQQWRHVRHIYTQLFFRYPSYNLAVVEITEPWTFDNYVGSIPYLSMDREDFDGVCKSIILKAYKSFSTKKTTYMAQMRMVPEKICEATVMKTVRLFYCTAFDPVFSTYARVPSGAGLVCHGTGDPQEKSEDEGILVGIKCTSQYGLPTLHHRVGSFYKWIKDGATPSVLSPCYTVIFSVYVTVTSYN